MTEEEKHEYNVLYSHYCDQIQTQPTQPDEHKAQCWSVSVPAQAHTMGDGILCVGVSGASC